MTGLVLLASYPKSGNTWLRAVLTGLRNEGVPVDINALDSQIVADRALFDDALEIETSDLLPREIARLQPSVYEIFLRTKKTAPYLKAHDAWLPAPGATQPPFPKAAIQAVIHVVRDPRDVAISFAHHIGKSVDQTIDIMRDTGFVLAKSQLGLGRQISQFLSSWSAHVDSWSSAGLPLLQVRYEDMIAEPAATFGAVARFLGLPDNPRLLADTLAATAFDKLQSEETGKGFREASRKATDRFFRQGRAGGWRDVLTPAQADRLLEDHGRVMQRLGYAG